MPQREMPLRDGVAGVEPRQRRLSSGREPGWFTPKGGSIGLVMDVSSRCTT